MHQLLATTSAHELAEWMALATVDEEERQQAELRATARAKLESRPRKR